MSRSNPSRSRQLSLSAITLATIIALSCCFTVFAQTPAPSPVPTATEPASRQLLQIEPQKQLPAKAKRWALVVGVDKYNDPQISPLHGAANDARILADALVRYSGFPQDQVILLATDQPAERQPTRVNLLRRLSNLAAAVPKDGLLLLSFSGHGMERGGQAFLLPSDAQISDQISFLEDTAVNVTRMRDLIRATGVAQVMILLDACRNDPGGRADAPNQLSQTYVNGFNFDVRNREVQAFATIYATAVGQRAYEYTEKKQGYFTWAIVEALKGGAVNPAGEVTLSELIKFVQDAVPKRIAIDLGGGKQQRPFATVEGYKAEELVLSAPGAGAASQAASVPSGGTFVDPAAIELSFWDTIKTSNNPDDFKAYLDKYPDGQFAVLARNRLNAAQTQRAEENTRAINQANEAQNALAELTFWSSIKENGGRDEIKAYLKKYPNGTFAAAARNRLREMDDSIDDSVWVGTSPGGDKFYEFKFAKGGVFRGSFMAGASMFANGKNDLEGTWSQSGNSININISSGRLKSQDLKATRTGGMMKGTWTQLTYSFELTRVLMKPQVTNDADEASSCNLRGITIEVIYRDKGGVNLADLAGRVSEKLRATNAQVKIEKGNNKDFSEKVVFNNSQSEMASRIAQCINDVVAVSPFDGGVDYSTPNVIRIYLQSSATGTSRR
jgi:hypothetical protein